MDELERAVVQLWEAKRLAARGDVAHGRLALLLLDNAAEMSLMRAAKSSMAWAEMYNNMAYVMRSVEPGDEKGQKLKEEIEARTLSKDRRWRIERYFELLVDYVFSNEKNLLPPEFAECLKILHRYRNAAHHRDTVREDVLGPAVQILFFLCCHLLKNEQNMHWFHEYNSAPSTVLEVFGDTPPEPTFPEAGAFHTGSLAGQIADRLLVDLALDHGGIANALSDHLLARLAAVDRHLTTIGESTPPGVNRSATLRLVQLAPREREDFDAEPPEDFWTRPLPVTQEVLEAWAVQAQDMRDIPIAHHALRAFSEIEKPLEELEDPVGRFIEDIDRAEQQRLDEMRGK
jgi:hypothetical protein